MKIREVWTARKRVMRLCNGKRTQVVWDNAAINIMHHEGLKSAQTLGGAVSWTAR